MPRNAYILVAWIGSISMFKVNQDLAQRFTSQGFFCYCELLQVTVFGGYLGSPGFYYRPHIIPSEGYLAPFGDTLSRVKTLLDRPAPGLLISFQQDPRGLLNSFAS
jgi:hypothetical protein